MCGILITTDEDVQNEWAEKRGGDSMCQRLYSKWAITHYELRIRGIGSIQPVEYLDRYIVLFNGEIYNVPNDMTELEFIFQIFAINEANPARIIEHLDGEYAIVILDEEKELAHLMVDPFATKPLYYTDQNEICSCARGLKGNIKRVLPNTAVTLGKETVIHRHEYFKSRITQTSTSFDRWCELFEESVAKRSQGWTRDVFMGLSSGYDSGAIACAMNKIGAEYYAYTIKAREDMKIVEARSKLIPNHEVMHFTRNDFDRHKQYVTANCDKTVIRYQPINDKASYGLSHICERAAALDQRVYLSGQGADEIICDYGDRGRKIFQSSQFGGLFPKDILSIFPYNNFYGEAQEGYLLKEEVVAGAYGIETRYPFLDKALVLEFLNLKTELKNKYYKSSIHYYLESNGFPFNVGDKRGFSANQGHDK